MNEAKEQASCDLTHPKEFVLINGPFKVMCFRLIARDRSGGIWKVHLCGTDFNHYLQSRLMGMGVARMSLTGVEPR